MSKNKWGIQFDGFTELAERYMKLGGDIKQIADDCLEFIPGKINPGLKNAMARHERTGKTVSTLRTSNHVEWTGDVGTIHVGFDISHGGLPSIFLMYGTARHIPVNQYGTPKNPGAQENPGMTADKKLFNAIYGNAIRKEIATEQERIFTNAIDKALGD